MSKQLTFGQSIQSSDWQKMIVGTLGDQQKKDRFVTAITSAVSANPKLAACDHKSIVVAGLLGETLNLSPSPQMGQYYVVPYGKTATFQLGYKGMIQLALRSGQYRKLNVLEVKQGELQAYNQFTEDIALAPILDPYQREATETVGYFAFLELNNGFQKSVYWSKAKVDAHRKKYSKGGTFWNDHYDTMAKKTVLRQLISKWGILSTEMAEGLCNDGEAPANQYAFDKQAPQLQQQVYNPPQQLGMPQEYPSSPPQNYPEPQVVNLHDL